MEKALAVSCLHQSSGSWKFCLRFVCVGTTLEDELARASFEKNTMHSYCSDTVSGRSCLHTSKTTFLFRNNFQPLCIFKTVIAVPNVPDKQGGGKLYEGILISLLKGFHGFSILICQVTRVTVSLFCCCCLLCF